MTASDNVHTAAPAAPLPCRVVVDSCLTLLPSASPIVAHTAWPPSPSPRISSFTMSSVLLFAAVAFAFLVLAFPLHVNAQHDPSAPLILDSYLVNETSRAEGRRLALVTDFPTVYSAQPSDPPIPIVFPFTQHAGYFTVTPSCSLFFQLFSRSSSSARARIVFLAGGPGLSSTYWTLQGHGPLSFQQSPSRLVYQNLSWAEDADLLLIDSPITVGWSQCSDDSVARNTTVVAEQLTVFMLKFNALFDPAQQAQLYVAGHSYGGIWAPMAAQRMTQAGITVTGVIVESGLSHAGWSTSGSCTALRQQGLYSIPAWAACQDNQRALQQAVQAADEKMAVLSLFSLLFDFETQTGMDDSGDWDRQEDDSYERQQQMLSFITNSTMRLALHTGMQTAYHPVVEYNMLMTDPWTGQSLTALDALLDPLNSTVRLLYYASNREVMHGAGVQQLLNQTTYAQQTGWMSETVAEPLTVQEQSGWTTRGLLKRDDRLWCAVTFSSGHAQSVIMPALTASLVRRFINHESPAAVEVQETPVLTQAEKLLPPSARRSVASRSAASVPSRSVDEPVVSPAVYLTPFLQQPNGASMAQQAAAVSLPGQSVLQDNSTYSGYVTVDAQHSSNTFFWLIPALDGNASAPLVLHLSGGPGISSMAMGLLYQHGPLFVVPNTSPPRVERRDGSYCEHYHMLYVDSPVGTGFSWTNSSAGLRTDSRDVARDLYEFLRQFYLLFPSYRTNRLYVHGVSYAGHFLPTLAARIHEENLRRPSSEYMPLEGILVASGWMDEESQTRHEGEFFVSIGRAELQRPAVLIGIRDLDWYNYISGDPWDEQEPAITAFLTHPEVLSALHAGPGGLTMSWYNQSVSKALQSDPSVKPEVETLLQSGAYQLLFFTAELDVVCAASGVLTFLSELQYSRDTYWVDNVTSTVMPQRAVPQSQSRQPPWTSPLQPWQPQPQEILLYHDDSRVLSYALIRFAGHLIEQTHLHQARNLIDIIVALPTLPKPPSAWTSSSSSSSSSSTVLSSAAVTAAVSSSAVSSSAVLSSSAGSSSYLPAASSASSASPSPSSSAVFAASSSSTGKADPADDAAPVPFIRSGAGISLMILLIFAVVIGVGAVVQWRRESRDKRRGGGSSNGLSDSLRDDGPAGDVYSRL